MHRNKSSSAGSLRHQQQQLQTHSPLRISEQMALVSNSARDGSGVNSIGQLEGTMTMLGTEENQPLARAETAPLPGRHRRHKDKLQGQLQQQGRGLGKSARPHTASHASATSLAVSYQLGNWPHLAFQWCAFGYGLCATVSLVRKTFFVTHTISSSLNICQNRL